MGCRGPVYRPALRGQWNDMEARWRYVSSSSDSRCWWDPEHSCCCCALADIHCLLLILPVPDPQVCMGGRLPVLDIYIYALPGSVRQGSEQGCTCLTLGSAPSTEEVEGRSASAKPQGRQSPCSHTAVCQQSRWPCGSSKSLAAGPWQAFNHC